MTCAKEGGKLWLSPSCSPHTQRLSLSLTHTHTTPPPMSLTCMLHSLDRHTVGNQNIITLSHTAANSGVATIQNSRAALTLNFHMKVGATKYRPAGRNWPAGREFETPGLDGGFLYPKMSPLYINTLYLHQEWVLSVEATMFFTVAQTGQTKHLLSFYDNWRLPQVLFHVWKRRVRGVQLQHETSPLDVTTFHTLTL